jgi:fructose-1-phosphate kinase PfkB-like protein
MIYTVTLNPAVDRELVVEEITFDTVLRASQFRVDCGGKGFNVAVCSSPWARPA